MSLHNYFACSRVVEEKIKKDLLEISDGIKKTTDDIKKTTCKNEMIVGNLVINISCFTADENVNQSLWLNIGISSDNTFVDKILSTCIVADYFYRIVMQDKDKQGINDLKEFNCQKKKTLHTHFLL